MLQPSGASFVPLGTLRIARAALSEADPYVQLRNNLGSVFSDEMFVHLFP